MRLWAVERKDAGGGIARSLAPSPHRARARSLARPLSPSRALFCFIADGLRCDGQCASISLPAPTPPHLPPYLSHLTADGMPVGVPPGVPPSSSPPHPILTPSLPVSLSRISLTADGMPVGVPGSRFCPVDEAQKMSKRLAPAVLNL